MLKSEIQQVIYKLNTLYILERFLMLKESI